MAVALAVLFVLLTAGEDDPAPDRPVDPQPVAKKPKPKRPALSLERQVGQLLIMSFAETETPAYISRRLRGGEGGGVILFANNVQTPTGLAAMTRAIQRAAGGGALIAVDQEGGDIRSVPFAGPEASQAFLSTPQAVTQSVTDAAVDLREVGVNVDLGPVADVASPAGSIVSARAFPGDAQQVSQLVQAAVRAHADERVGATAKHFPGLGAATTNTDDQAVTIETARTGLTANDLMPFRAAIDARVPLVMASHALYPALDPASIASQSKLILDDLLREEMGFEGAVVTDSIEAQSVLDRSSVAEAAEASIESGADLILMTGAASWNQVYPVLLERARSDDEFRARVRAASNRVLALKRRLGLKVPR